MMSGGIYQWGTDKIETRLIVQSERYFMAGNTRWQTRSLRHGGRRIERGEVERDEEMKKLEGWR